uniref:Uncharacterized protein n=1 Tax=Quercus lobata TaxID=97700 RepID=A0A7N2LT78_QUELO
MGCESKSLEIDEEKLNKKRKFLDGIGERVELLRSGLKVNHNAIELNTKFLTHIHNIALTNRLLLRRYIRA